MFTNNLKQTLIPGDRVVVVSKSYGHVKVSEGVFHGITKSGTPQAAVPATRGFYVNKNTGERAISAWEYMRRNHPQLRSWGNDASEYRKHEQAYASTIEYRREPYQRIATLPLGRIYKLA